MPQYGKLKIDQFLYNDSGTDVTLDLANIASRGANTFTGNLSLGDNLRIRLGNGPDLQIFHDGTNSVITNATGDLYINNNADTIIKPANDCFIKPQDGEDGIKVIGNGAVELYYDNSKKLETVSDGLILTGNLRTGDGNYIGMGNMNDLQIWHSGANKIVSNNSMTMYIGADQTQITNAGITEACAKFMADGAVELYYDNSKKFETISSGAYVYGNLYANDNDQHRFGNDGDLQIYHDSNNSWIKDAGSGSLVLDTNSAVQITANAGAENIAKFFANDRVELYYDNAKKLETVSYGVIATGGIYPPSNDSGQVGGSSNRWSEIHANDFIDLPDNGVVRLGNSDDLQIYHDGSDSYLLNATGQLILRTASVDSSVVCKPNAATELYYDGSKKLETTTGGVNVVGALTVNGSALASGLSSDAQKNTVGGTNAGNSFSGTDANNNTLLGYNAGTAITSGDSNTAIGYNSLQAVETASFNVAIGNHAGYSVSSGEKCVYLGDYSGYNSTTGHGNIGIGESSMGHSAAVTGHYNIGIGRQAFKGDGGAAISNHYNIALGAKALQRQTSATENIAIGMEAGMGPSSGGLYGGYNIFIGSYAGHKVESGQVNCLVGRSAGAFLTSGDHNLLLGYAAGNTASPSGQITTADDIVCLGDNNITNLYCADTSISSSDKRDKTDVTDFTHGLKWINQLKPVTYRWDKRTWYDEYNEDGSLKTAGTPDGTKKRARQHIGFLAQDVLAVEQADGFASKKDDMLVVNLNEDDTAYGLKYERLVPVLVNAIKELSAKVEALEAK